MCRGLPKRAVQSKMFSSKLSSSEDGTGTNLSNLLSVIMLKGFKLQDNMRVVTLSELQI
jgi:hypothetical protein